MTNTSVEWSRIDVNEPGRVGLSYLTTSNSVKKDQSRGDLIKSWGDNTEIVKAYHNHPSGSPIPSGSHDTDNRWSSKKEHKADALALGADEGRDKLR